VGKSESGITRSSTTNFPFFLLSGVFLPRPRLAPVVLRVLLESFFIFVAILKNSEGKKYFCKTVDLFTSRDLKRRQTFILKMLAA
jgi:hypothetical protein